MSDAIDGIWRLVSSQAWDAAGHPAPAPYGSHPMGQIMFSQGRMLAVLCNGDDGVPLGGRGFSSYGGTYTFDGSTLAVQVDVASDPSRIGGVQVRGVEMRGERMLLRPPARAYGDAAVQRRELLWERAWHPAAA